MAARATPTYRLGDLLALARQDWVRQMSVELAERGYPDYRRSDAASLRLLAASAMAIGELGSRLGATRQAARKVVRGLEDRGYAVTSTDSADARKTIVTLTDAGRRYSGAVIAVIDHLNRALAERVSTDQLAAADTVLRAALTGGQAQRRAMGIPPP